MEVTSNCINFNDRVRKVPKMYYLDVWNVSYPKIIIFWNFSDPIVEANAVVRHFRQPWILIVGSFHRKLATGSDVIFPAHFS
jgi:hypothetical protein